MFLIINNLIKSVDFYEIFEYFIPKVASDNISFEGGVLGFLLKTVRRLFFYLNLTKMNKIDNFLIKSLSFDVFQLIVFNCEISMRFKFYGFCKELKVFACKYEFFNYWKEIINFEHFNNYKTNEMLKYSKQTNIIKKLSKFKIREIITLLKSVYFYETFEYFIDFIELNEDIAYDLINMIFTFLSTPTNKKQQKIQFEIIKKLIKYRSSKDYLRDSFNNVIWSLNISLVDFVIKEFDININDLFRGYTVLSRVVYHLSLTLNQNNVIVYEMLDHLLSIGADINLLDRSGNDIYFSINNKITNKTIKKDLLDILLNFKELNIHKKNKKNYKKKLMKLFL